MHVREWNPQTEDLRDETEMDPNQVERYKISMCSIERMGYGRHVIDIYHS